MAKKVQLNLDRRANNKKNSKKPSSTVDPLKAITTISKITTSAKTPVNSVVRKQTPQQKKPVVTPKKPVVVPKKNVTPKKPVVVPKKNVTPKKSSSTNKPTTAPKSYVQSLWDTTLGAKDPGFTAEAKAKKAEWDASQNAQAQDIINAQKLIDQGYAQQNEQGRQSIEQNQFQQYLQARQAMANRGLAGSGIAEDANARVAMAGNAQLSNMLTKNNLEQAQEDQKYQAQVNEIYRNRDKMTQSDFEKELRTAWEEKQQKMFDNGVKMAPYYQMTANEQATSALGYTNALGYMIDPATGQPVYSNGQMVSTLGRDKLSASVATSKAAMDAKYARIQADVNIAAAKAKATKQGAATTTRMKVYQGQLNAISKQINTYINRGMTPPQELYTQYNTANQNLYNLIDSI